MKVQKIQGEEAFQVMAHSFIVSPSEEGYTLEYSADGREFTAWDVAVPKGEVLNVCGNAMGAFFRFIGNKSDVIVRY